METVSAKELDRYVRDRDAVIVDLRPRADFLAGHIRGAVNVPHGMFRGELRGQEQKVVVLYCERGGLSMSVARELERSGYQTRSVVGGIRAYRGENLVRFRS